MNPLVSVIIPTYNRTKLIQRALKSAFDQTYPNFEVIVVDDGSTDQTVLQLEHHPHLVLIHKKNEGVSAARNTGIGQARGKLIAFLDSDDEWLPKKLERQVEFFEKNPEAMICQTDEIWIRNGKRVNPMKKHKKYSGWIFKECLPLCIVSPSAVMMRRELFDIVGNFDESLPACEDYDLWLRVAARFPIYFIGEKLVVKYGGHADQLSRTVENLDRYRIQALMKILDCRGWVPQPSGAETTPLQPDQWQSAFTELKKKCLVYGNGCRKRGKSEEAKKYLQLPDEINSAGARKSEAASGTN